MKEKQKLILLIVMLIVVIGSAVILYERFSQNAIEAESNVTTEANVNNNMPENNENAKSDVLDIELSNFETEVIKSEKKVLIDFYADWCGPCQKLSPIVDKFAEEHSEIKVVRIDIDAQEDLADRYNIRSIPTLVVIENGEEINRVIGLVSEEKIIELCK
jgi:thioredoxin 1